MGNGGEWGDTAKRLGYRTSQEPQAGWLISFSPGTAGSSPVYGHVAFVEAVTSDGILISEGNVLGGTIISYRVITNSLARSGASDLCGAKIIILQSIKRLDEKRTIGFILAFGVVFSLFFRLTYPLYDPSGLWQLDGADDSRWAIRIDRKKSEIPTVCHHCFLSHRGRGHVYQAHHRCPG